ncbi:MAG: hypothetical protein M1839_008033 [Geoglossum umbratile]|nr:MAG: hypothetical protein M1839_008033 [Geoglossum umbratile]
MSEPSHPSRRFLALPVETTTRNRRNRIAVDPIETTSKSNRKKPTTQSLETRGNAKDERAVETTTKVTHGRFMLEPAQTKTTTENTPGESAAGPAERKTESHKSTTAPVRVELVTKRKFAPQLIETTRRSRRSGDTYRVAERHRNDDDDSPPLLPHERTRPPPHLLGDGDDDGPPLLPHERTRSPPRHPARPGAWDMSERRRPMPIPPANTRAPSSADVLQCSMPRRTSSTHPHDNTRRHSFVVPSLEPIISQPNSDESNCPSLSTSPSLTSETSSLADLWHYASGMRESGDGRFSGYLLALAARAAEKQLREQAMAAYANDDYHEPVEHFANDRESDESDTDVLELELPPRRGNAGVDAMRRNSREEFRWEARDTRKPQVQLNQQGGEQKNHKLDLGLTRRPSIINEIATSARLAATDASGAPENIIGGWQRGVGLAPMRNAASPPMLGGNLEFRLCYSPRQTTSELDHLNGPGASRNKNGGGLWMGLCSAKPKGGATASKKTPRSGDTPCSTLTTFRVKGAAGERDIKAEIDREFTDEFVTQVYNYLSLGYPCLARKFDEELSHVSGVPLEEISSSDSLADAKGYVGLGEGAGVAMAGSLDGRCSRWKALRSYIREWAKQSPVMERGGAGLNTWGMRARKGSWAI